MRGGVFAFAQRRLYLLVNCSVPIIMTSAAVRAIIEYRWRLRSDFISIFRALGMFIKAEKGNVLHSFVLRLIFTPPCVFKTLISRALLEYFELDYVKCLVEGWIRTCAMT